MLFLTPRFARCRGKHRLRRHLPPQGSRSLWLNEATTREADQLMTPANSKPELVLVGVLQRHRGKAFCLLRSRPHGQRGTESTPRLMQ